MREFQYNQHTEPSCDSLGKIAWVRKDFLSQGKISDILIRCARKLDYELLNNNVNYEDADQSPADMDLQLNST